MKLLFNQLSLILKLKARSIIYLFKYRNDAAYLISVILISLFLLGNLFSSISLFNVPLVKLFNSSDSNLKLLLTELIAIIMMTVWILLSTIGGIDLSKPLNKNQILRYPINFFNFAIINVISQLFDIGVILFSPVFILLIYTLGIESLIDIFFSIIIFFTFLILLITVVNILKLLINSRKSHSKTEFYLGQFFLIIITGLNTVLFIVILNNFSADSFAENVSQYFFVYPTILLVEAINNIAFGNYNIALFWWIVLLIEVGVIFSFYLLTLRYATTSISSKNKLSGELFSVYYKLNLGEKLFLNLINFVPHNYAFIVKDIFYLLRNSRIQVWFLLLCACVWFIAALQIDTFFKYIIMISLPMMILFPLASNIFAFENSGLILYFISPISVRNAIFHKNIAISIIDFLFTIPIIIWALIINLINIESIIATIPVLLYQIYSLSIFGNVISIYFPYRVKYDSAVGQFNSMASQPYIFLSFAVTEGLLALLVVMFFENKFALLSLLFLLSIIQIKVYNSLSKSFFKSIFIKRKESLIKELIKSEIKFYE